MSAIVFVHVHEVIALCHLDSDVLPVYLSVCLSAYLFVFLPDVLSLLDVVERLDLSQFTLTLPGICMENFN